MQNITEINRNNRNFYNKWHRYLDDPHRIKSFYRINNVTSTTNLL